MRPFRNVGFVGTRHPRPLLGFFGSLSVPVGVHVFEHRCTYQFLILSQPPVKGPALPHRTWSNAHFPFLFSPLSIMSSHLEVVAAAAAQEDAAIVETRRPSANFLNASIASKCSAATSGSSPGWGKSLDKPRINRAAVSRSAAWAAFKTARA